MTVADEEYRRVKALNEHYAERIVQLLSLLNEMREILRLARKVVDAAPDELFLEELRDALTEVEAKEVSG